MKEFVTSGEIAEATGRTIRAVQKMAQKQGWNAREVKNPKGGIPIKKFPLSSLPQDMQLAIKSRESKEITKEREAASVDTLDCALITAAKKRPALPVKTDGASSSLYFDTKTGDGLRKAEKERELQRIN